MYRQAHLLSSRSHDDVHCCPALVAQTPNIQGFLGNRVSYLCCVRPRLLWLPLCVKLKWQWHSTCFAGVGLNGTSSSHGKGHPTPSSCLQGDWATSKTLQRDSVMAGEMPSATPWSAENSHGFMRRPLPPQKPKLEFTRIRAKEQRHGDLGAPEYRHRQGNRQRALGSSPQPRLALPICDPAMTGSGFDQGLIKALAETIVQS